MTEDELKLCDGRAAVYAALKRQTDALNVPLQSGYARTPAAGERVTWGEWANRSTERPVVDELIYQVTLRARRFDRLHELCAGVNRAMLELGLRRVYSSPDSFESEGEGMYSKTFRFGRKVDKRFFTGTVDSARQKG